MVAKHRPPPRLSPPLRPEIDLVTAIRRMYGSTTWLEFQRQYMQASRECPPDTWMPLHLVFRREFIAGMRRVMRSQARRPTISDRGYPGRIFRAACDAPESFWIKVNCDMEFRREVLPTFMRRSLPPPPDAAFWRFIR